MNKMQSTKKPTAARVSLLDRLREKLDEKYQGWAEKDFRRRQLGENVVYWLERSSHYRKHKRVIGINAVSQECVVVTNTFRNNGEPFCPECETPESVIAAHA